MCVSLQQRFPQFSMDILQCRQKAKDLISFQLHLDSEFCYSVGKIAGFVIQLGRQLVLLFSWEDSWFCNSVGKIAGFIIQLGRQLVLLFSWEDSWFCYSVSKIAGFVIQLGRQLVLLFNWEGSWFCYSVGKIAGFVIQFGISTTVYYYTLSEFSVLMAEKCNSLPLSCCKYCIQLFCYYILVYFNLLSVYHCISKGFQK